MATAPNPTLQPLRLFLLQLEQFARELDGSNIFISLISLPYDESGTALVLNSARLPILRVQHAARLVQRVRRGRERR